MTYPATADAPTRTDLTDEERKTIARLCERHDLEIPGLEELDGWYEGTCSPRRYLHPEVLKESGDRIRPVMIAWGQLAIDAIVERQALQGLKGLDEKSETAKEFLRVWRANQMDLGLSQAITDALVMRRSYISVGTNEDDPQTPYVMPESPLEAYVEPDPRTKKGRAAIKRITDVDGAGTVIGKQLTLYLPNETVWCEWGSLSGEAETWHQVDRDVHNLGELPIASLINRPRTRSGTLDPRNARIERIGRSDLDAVIPLADAATKLATDMMVAAEFVAIPLRALFGVGPQDFTDEKGNPMTPMRALQGRLLTIDEQEVKAFEFAAAQLNNFTQAMREMSQMVSSVTGLPPHYLGTPSDNPASADAITASEARLNTRAELKHTMFDPGILTVARLIRRFQTGKWDPEVDKAEIDWRNVRTPTIGAMSDYAMKLGPKDKPILPMRQTRQALGYSDPEIDVMEAEDEAEAERAPAAALARAVTGAGPAAG